MERLFFIAVSKRVRKQKYLVFCQLIMRTVL